MGCVELVLSHRFVAIVSQSSLVPNIETNIRQKSSLHWHLLHCGNGVPASRSGIFRNCRWTCNNSDRAEKGRRCIRFHCWAAGLLHCSQSHVSGGDVLLISYGRHKSFFSTEGKEGHERVIAAFGPAYFQALGSQCFRTSC